MFIWKGIHKTITSDSRRKKIPQSEDIGKYQKI